MADHHDRGVFGEPGGVTGKSLDQRRHRQLGATPGGGEVPGVDQTIGGEDKHLTRMPVQPVDQRRLGEPDAEPARATFEDRHPLSANDGAIPAADPTELGGLVAEPGNRDRNAHRLARGLVDPGENLGDAQPGTATDRRGRLPPQRRGGQALADRIDDGGDETTVDGDRHRDIGYVANAGERVSRAVYLEPRRDGHHSSRYRLRRGILKFQPLRPIFRGTILECHSLGGIRMRILLVDDDDLSRATIHQMLERAGHLVVSTGIGGDAITMFRADPPDLTITDLIMPDTDGLELIQELRKIDGSARIIAISGGGRVNANEYLTVARKFGAAAALAKPFSNQELKDTVAAVTADGPPKQA